MFCSSSIGIHLLRGAGAVILLGLAFLVATHAAIAPAVRLGAAPLAVGAFLLLRGCPMCWLMGLFETIGKRKGMAP